MKLTIAIEYSMIKMKVDDEDEDPDEINLVRVGRERIGISKTKAVNVYNTGSIRPTILNLKRELETKFFNGLENQVGSNWAIDKVIKLFAHTYTLKTKKGSSYIPTPARFAASKCGLINIRNEDQFCFRWCMLYHQSEQSKHSHRLTVLEKLEDKFNYESITYPTSLQDIQQFEEDNEITINVFTIKGGDELVNLQDGDVQHCRKGMVNLLFIEEGEQGHYIYIKKLEHLYRTTTQTGYSDRRYCPYCRTGVWCKDETFEDHLMTKHFSTKNNCNLELPEPGATMKFQNFKDMLIRPFVV
jgi:hypothetical protein